MFDKTVLVPKCGIFIPLSERLWINTAFSIISDVWSGFLREGSCLICVIYVCLHIVVSNTYCVVFLFCCSLSCVPYVANFSGLSIYYCSVSIL